VKIFRKLTLREASVVANAYSPDLIMGTPLRFTQGGFAVLAAQDSNRTSTVGWGGAGGTMIRYRNKSLADSLSHTYTLPLSRIRFSQDLKLGVAYVTNKLGLRMAMNDPRPNALLAVTIKCATAKS